MRYWLKPIFVRVSSDSELRFAPHHATRRHDGRDAPTCHPGPINPRATPTWATWVSVPILAVGRSANVHDNEFALGPLRDRNAASCAPGLHRQARAATRRSPLRRPWPPPAPASGGRWSRSVAREGRVAATVAVEVGVDPVRAPDRSFIELCRRPNLRTQASRRRSLRTHRAHPVLPTHAVLADATAHPNGQRLDESRPTQVD